MTEWVYLQSEETLWTVGVYDGDGKWRPATDHGTEEEAAERVAYLNGSYTGRSEQQVRQAISTWLQGEAATIGNEDQAIALEWAAKKVASGEADS